MAIKNYPDSYDKVPAKKQVKINISLDLKSMPFTIPEITITYFLKGRTNSLCLFLPCPPHRFIHFDSINPR